MTSTHDINIKTNIEATVNSYLASFIDAKAQNDPSLVNRNTSPDCIRQMLPTSLSGGGSMNNEDYQKVFAQGVDFAGMKKNTASDIVIDVDARKAAVTAVAELELPSGDKFNLDFAWFLHLNDDGSKIKKIVEFVDSDTFKGVQQKAPAPSDG